MWAKPVKGPRYEGEISSRIRGRLAENDQGRLCRQLRNMATWHLITLCSVLLLIVLVNCKHFLQADDQKYVSIFTLKII